ncbi:hypothetical protein EMWEY_00032120 [Eimeria maxima]|uniref:Uncharacterized protein n=1 Tax=Eimeria maxima TaxID=5804 RepID=U6MDQ9_EIMMA|nr:hypothetical protein EMWEY_00032120 [Eimeria maxima]CDJ60569.1 hypothetical protein EMWEY_00032120 [Eimeria maxima]
MQGPPRVGRGGPREKGGSMQGAPSSAWGPPGAPGGTLVGRRTRQQQPQQHQQQQQQHQQHEAADIIVPLLGRETGASKTLKHKDSNRGNGLVNRVSDGNCCAIDGIGVIDYEIE